jgi:hypothetical protein
MSGVTHSNNAGTGIDSLMECLFDSDMQQALAKFLKHIFNKLIAALGVETCGWKRETADGAPLRA